MRDPRAAACLLVAGLALALGLVAFLSHPSQRRAGTNGVQNFHEITAPASTGAAFCQGGELLPRDTTSVHLWLTARGNSGPELFVTFSAGGRTLTTAHVPAGWRGSPAVVPIARTTRDRAGVDVCVRVGRGGSVGLLGSETPPGAGTLRNGTKQTGLSIRIDYLRPGRESWWTYASTMAARLGLGHGSWGGGWLAVLVVVLVLASIALAVRVVLETVVAERPERAALWRIPRTAWAIAAIAALNAAAWSLIAPAFQGPDEITHFAYVQQIGETGQPPVKHRVAILSPELRTMMVDLHQGAVGISEQEVAIWSPLEEVRLERDLSASLPRTGNGDSDASDTEPPLYYALEAIPYSLARGGTLLDRLALMRLLSAAMAGATALLVFLFVRECIPRLRWAWSVAGVGAAFVPMLGFVSGVVNPDALLYATTAALFLCLARAFRRGMTRRLAIWIGVVLAIGMVGKINFYGLVPGALAATALAARRGEGAWNGRALRLSAIAAGIGLGVYVLGLGLDALVWNRPAILAKSAAQTHAPGGGLGGQLSYLWQVYLPPLPGQRDWFAGLSVPYDLWFKSFIGDFGPLVVQFPASVYRLALVVCALVGGSALRALVLERAELRRRGAELLGYVLIVGGLLLLIAMVALRGWAPGIAAAAQGRYLLPLLALFAALLALAARGAGARWGRALGVAIVVLTIALSVFGQLLTVVYFYG